MTERKQDSRRRNPPPFDESTLKAAAVRYVERFQTTEARLVRHLRDKLRHRGWSGETPPDPEALAAKLVEQGYVNDRAFAEARTRQSARRGDGARKLVMALGADGIDREMAASLADSIDPVEAARAFARRRRFGPYGPAVDEAVQRRQFAAMLRAGHSPAIARRILQADSEDMFDEMIGED